MPMAWLILHYYMTLSNRIILGLGITAIFALTVSTIVDLTNHVSAQSIHIENQNENVTLELGQLIEPTEPTSQIEDRLQYKDQHTTFDRNGPQEYNYTVGGNGLDPIANYIINKTKHLPHPTL